jgi:hypothetical protein
VPGIGSGSTFSDWYLPIRNGADEWDFNGILMGFQWDFNGILMGFQWDFNGIYNLI